MTLVEHTAEVAVQPLLSRIDLSDHEQELLGDVLRDITGRPPFAIKRRHGKHTFVVVPANVILSLGMVHSTIRQSKLVLERHESFCTLDVLRRVVQVACRETGVSCVEVHRLVNNGTTHYTYTVSY